MEKYIFRIANNATTTPQRMTIFTHFRRFILGVHFLREDDDDDDNRMVETSMYMILLEMEMDINSYTVLG